MPSDAKTLNAEGRNANFYCIKEVLATFKKIGEKIYNFGIVEKLDLLFISVINKENFIKDVESTSSGSGEKRIIKDETKKRSENWKSFLGSDSVTLRQASDRSPSKNEMTLHGGYTLFIMMYFMMMAFHI